MSPPKQTPDEWLQSPQAQKLWQIEAHCLARIMGSKWGDHLVQVGGPSIKTLRDVSPIIHHVCFNDQAQSFEEASVVRVDYEELAFMPNSVDIIVMPHLLEKIAQPQNLLKELYLALKPEGLLISLSFNPYGLGMSWYWSLKRHYPALNWHWWPAYRLREWLQAAGFEQIQQQSVGFLPCTKQQLKKNWIEKVYAWFFPLMGAVNVLVAKKQIVDPLLTVEWSTKPNLGVLQNQRYE